MAEAPKTRTCNGCGRKTDNSQHCQYPSNPVANAEARGQHRAAKLSGIRQARAAKIKARNAVNAFGGSGSNGSWWEGNPRLVKVGTAAKGGGDIFAMMSQRYSTKQS